MSSNSTSNPNSEARGPGPSRPSRRSLLTGTAAAAGAAIASTVAARPRSAAATQSGSSAAPWHEDPVLVAVAPLVLPSADLEPVALERALRRFSAWADGFEPVAELDHRYLSSDEIPYGPPDPRPLWRAQLEALDTEARKRHLVAFAELERDQQREMVTRAVERSTPREPGAGLPRPEHAPHVAVALMAWYFGSSDANDLCHGRRIGRHECRGMRGVDLEPRPLPVG